jgi:hypothetical protein
MESVTMDDDIEMMFEPQSTNDDQRKRMEHLRSMAKGFAEAIMECCQGGPRRALALRSVEVAAMWAVKSITHG